MRKLKNNKEKIIFIKTNNDNIYVSLKNYILDTKISIKKINTVSDIQPLTNAILILDETNKKFITEIKNSNITQHVSLIILDKEFNPEKYKNIKYKQFVIKPLKIVYLANLINNILKEILINKNSWRLNKNKTLLLGPNNESIRLTEKESSIISILIKSNERPVRKDTLLSEAFGYNKHIKLKEIDTKALETHISRIRKKLRSSNNTPTFIKTFNGYMLKINL